VKRIGLAVALLLVGPPSRAPRSRPRAAFTAGSAAFDAGQFAEAARLFDVAFVQSHEPKLLWNVAVAYRRQYELDQQVVNLRRAALVYHNYAELAESDAERGEALKAEQEVRAQLEKVEAQGAKPAPTPSREPARPSEGTRSRAPGIAVAAGGAVVVGAGLLFGALAADAASTVSSTGTPQDPAPFSHVKGDYARGEALGALAVACYVVGAAALVAGVVLAIVRPGRARATALVAPAAGHALGVSW
jgi:hypothetical protein